MAKFLRHLGLGYGNNKKSETFVFEAKTLPASTADCDRMRVTGDTSQSCGKRSAGCKSHTVDSAADCGSLPSHVRRRASNETFLTTPARGLRARHDRDWSLRGTKNRVPLELGGPRDTELTYPKKRCSSHAKDLRRSVTADEVSWNANSANPAVCIFKHVDILNVQAWCMMQCETLYSMCGLQGPTKHRTDRTGKESAAGKAQINCRDPVINLYTAYHALHNESSHKFHWTKFTDDRRTTCYRKRRNTAPTAPAEKLMQQKHELTTANL